jgi:hypothetical protein
MNEVFSASSKKISIYQIRDRMDLNASTRRLSWLAAEKAVNLIYRAETRAGSASW